MVLPAGSIRSRRTSIGGSVVPELAAGAAPPGVVLRPLAPRVDRELALAVPSLEEAPRPRPTHCSRRPARRPFSRKEVDNRGFGMP
jgi:hypothetical protein